MTKYKNKVLFLHKSKTGNHLYAFNRDAILAEGVESLIMNVSDVKRLIEGSTTWIKVSVMNGISAEKTAEEDEDEGIKEWKKTFK